MRLILFMFVTHNWGYSYGLCWSTYSLSGL